MTTFADSEELYKIFGAFLAEVVNEPDMRPKFVNSDTSFLVTYTDPSARILVDCTVDPPVVTNDPPEDVDTEIRLTMSADDGHKFWCGKLNMTIALAKKQVSVSGPMSKMMKLLPAMRPAFPKYTAYLEQHGYAEKAL
jgi:putative sterol carrier protein